jgi:hypothetical protein
LRTAKNRSTTLVIPHFDSEDEEEKWLWRHRRQLEEEMGRALKEGRTLSTLPSPKSSRLRKRSA